MNRRGIDTGGLSIGTVYSLSCISSCVAETVTFPLDILKTRIQAEKMATLGDHSSYRRRLMEIVRESVAKEEGGVLNLFRGLTPACLRHLIYSGARLPLYEYMREQVLGREPDGSFPLRKAVPAAMFSGALAQSFSNPTDVIKVRMQTEQKRRRAGLPPLYRDTWDAFVKLAQEGGVRGLMRGWGPNCQRAALVQLGDLCTYDTVKQHLVRDMGMSDGSHVHAMSSLAAAVLAAVIGTPADLVKTRIMNQPVDPVTGKGLIYRSAMHCLNQTLREEGVSALWRGTTLNWLRMAPWSLTFYLTFEQARAAMGLHSF